MKSDMEKIWMGVISAFVIVGTFYLSFFMVVTDDMTHDQSSMAHLILGYTFGLSNVVIGHYFMSSKGSRDKTRMISDMMKRNHRERVERSIAMTDDDDDKEAVGAILKGESYAEK